MEASDEKDIKPVTNDAPAIKRAYAKPELIEFGDVKELTQGAGLGSPDLNGTRRR